MSKKPKPKILRLLSLFGKEKTFFQLRFCFDFLRFAISRASQLVRIQLTYVQD